jgi:hypothetical protein
VGGGVNADRLAGSPGKNPVVLVPPRIFCQLGSAGLTHTTQGGAVC